MLTITVILLTAASVSIATVDVATHYGVYTGFVEETHGVNVTKFLGIPYAKPPVGDRRFRRPEALRPSRVTVDCTRTKPGCPGIDGYGSRNSCASHSPSQRTSEDCLYLNVYVPGLVDGDRTGSLAVLVWIHGDRTSAGPLQDGSRLALTGDVIVVTLNFRLGFLGFLTTGDSVSTGNWGLLDQVKGLEWVRDNIAHFGGDPHRVTLFGKSTGAEAVGLHVLSPLSRGLFKRAISHSGTSTMIHVNRHPLERVAKIAHYVNCSSNPTVVSATTLNCLRATSLCDLVRADCSVSASVPPFSPNVDGHFLHGHPEKLVQSGMFAPVDYILGMDRDDGTATIEALPDFREGEGIDRTTFGKLLLQMYSSRFPQSPPSDVAWSALLSRYLPADDTLLAYARSYLDVYRDAFALQILSYAKYHSSKGRCFVYYFPHRATTSDQTSYTDAANSTDVNFVFGDILGYGTTSEKNLSVDWMQAWALFARDGRTRFRGRRISWPTFNASDRFYLDIAINMTEANVKNRLLEGGQRLWTDVLPALITMTTNRSMPVSRPGIQSMTKENRRELEWGMTGTQLEELLLSLLITVTFLVVICATLVRMICYVEHKSKSRKPRIVNGKASHEFTANISRVGTYKPTLPSCHQNSAGTENSTRL